MTPRKRVLYITHGHPDLAAGGGELAGYYMHRSMETTSHFESFLLAAVRPQDLPLRGATRLMQHEKEANTQFHVFSDKGYDHFFHTGSDLSDLPNYLAAVQPDVVHLHHYLHFGIDLIWLLRRCLPNAKIVLTLHEFVPICAHDGSMIKTGNGQLCNQATALECARCFPDRPIQDFALRAKSFRQHLSLVDRLIASSHFQKKRFVEWGVPSELIDVLENGRPLWNSTKKAEHPAGQPFVAAFLGQIVFHKGVDVLLEAAAEYLRVRKKAPDTTPELRFSIHGVMQTMPDALRNRIDQLLKECGSVVRHHGRYSRDQVPAILSNAHCVVVPSKWWENSPLVIQEAYLAGRPVVCSDIGGMAEKVQHGKSGLHFRMGDPLDLLQKLLELARSPKLYHELVEGIPPVFSDEAMSRWLHEFYQGLLQSKSPSIQVGAENHAA